MKGKESITRLIYKSKRYLKKSTPTILTIACSVGTVASVVLAVKATPRAMERITDATKEKGEPLTKMEIVNVAGPAYIPTILVSGSTVVGVISLHIINKRRQEALLSGYMLLKQTYERYRKASNEVFGADAEQKIMLHMAERPYIDADGMLVYNPESEEEEALFYDMASGRYFNSTHAAIVNAQYHVNRMLVLRGYVSLNDWYDYLGLSRLDSGDDFGWEIGEMMEGGIMWLDFSNAYTNIKDSDVGMCCYIISAAYDPTPLYDIN